MKYCAFFIIVTSLLIGCEQTTPVQKTEQNRTIVEKSFSKIARSLRESKGQLLYVPIYSELRSMEDQSSKLLNVQVSIRNTDMNHPISIAFADYYDNDGKLLRNYLEEPLKLGPLGSQTIVIRQSDTEGGIGANMLLEWHADTTVHEPLVEAIMIDNLGNKSFAFTSRAIVLKQD
ncbi:DUF3124 domain-containing protein [Limibacter armeniacum]|uniref:DUF3124 domain-containing protein n=1 Tax=Limibacter armeniacum TaxID=466084 RepID=UPI002FE63818